MIGPVKFILFQVGLIGLEDQDPDRPVVQPAQISYARSST